LHRVMREPELAARLGWGALQTVRAHYSRARVAAGYVELFTGSARR